MRKGFQLITLVLLMMVVTVACGTRFSNETATGSTEVTGPALVMFYTDN